MNNSAHTHIKTVRFLSDGLLINGYLHLPPDVSPDKKKDKKNKPPVVFGCHGLFSSADSEKQKILAQKCTRKNIAFFRIDHRGCGKSEGDFNKVTSLKGRCQDLADAVKTVMQLPETGKSAAFFGSSFGASVCLALIASENLDIASLVTLAGPLRSRPVAENINRYYQKNPGETPPIPDFDFSRNSFDIASVIQMNPINNILIFHGNKDEIVPFEHGLELFRITKEPKKLVTLENAGHPLENPQHKKTFFRETIKWLESGFLKNIPSRTV
jgi:alpha-beta hydrolase superfamily lysophospholipase